MHIMEVPRTALGGTVTKFQYRSVVDVPSDELFAWHARPGAVSRLMPPWENLQILQDAGSLEDGSEVVFRLSRGPVSMRWVAKHTGCHPGEEFRDVQVSGPFKSWVHTHRFISQGDGQAVLEDDIEYALPLGALGDLVGKNYVANQLERMFVHRHAQTRNDIIRHHEFADRQPQRVVISGATGMIGSQLVSFLRSGGHQVDRLSRREPAPGTTDIQWNPATSEIDAQRLEGADVVIHLAGENIGGGRWSTSRKRILEESRVQGTTLLCETLAGLKSPPRVLISMSGSGHYGYRDFTPKSEDQPAGDDFLAQLTVAWEQATEVAEKAGIRVAILRTPMVLCGRGGALEKMLPPFKMGVGGIIGKGTQPMSWVALDDLLGIFLFTMFTDSIKGPINAASPNVVGNREFTRVLGRVLRRPTMFPLPSPIVRVLFGEMGEALLLGGQHLDSSKLVNHGFSFLLADLEAALRHELGCP